MVRQVPWRVARELIRNYGRAFFSIQQSESIIKYVEEQDELVRYRERLLKRGGRKLEVVPRKRS